MVSEILIGITHRVMKSELRIRKHLTLGQSAILHTAIYTRRPQFLLEEHTISNNYISILGSLLTCYKTLIINFNYNNIRGYSHVHSCILWLWTCTEWIHVNEVNFNTSNISCV